MKKDLTRMVRSSLSIVLVSLLCDGCAHDGRQIASVGVAGSPQVQVQVIKKGPYDEIQAPDFTGVVFQKHGGESVSWVPTLDQIHEVEKHFERFVRNSNPEVYIRLRTYRRQYFGYGPDVARRVHAYFTCVRDEDLSDPRAEGKSMETSDCRFSLNFEYASKKVSGYRPPEADTEDMDESDL